MKTLFVFLLAMGYSQAFSQSDTNNFPPEEVLPKITLEEKMPVIQGCEDVAQSSNSEINNCMQTIIGQHVSTNFFYSKFARRQKVTANIYVSFVVEKDGVVSTVEIVRGASLKYANGSEKEKRAAKELDDEAIRVMSLLKFVEPATQSERPVKMSLSIPIYIKLE